MTGERRRVGERGSEGGTQEEPEGGVAERGEQQIQRGHHHTAGFFHTAKPGFSGSAHWSYVIRTKGSRTEESHPPSPLPRPNLTSTASQLLWATLLWAFWEFKLFDFTPASLRAGHETKPRCVQVRGGCRSTKMLRYLLKTLLQMNLFTDTIRNPSNGSESFFNASLPSFNASLLEWGNFSGFNGRNTHFSSSLDACGHMGGGFFCYVDKNFNAAWKEKVQTFVWSEVRAEWNDCRTDEKVFKSWINKTPWWGGGQHAGPSCEGVRWSCLLSH